MKEINKDCVYTVNEVADILRIRQETVLRNIYAKKIRACKVGRVWRVQGDDIMRYMRERENIKKVKFLEDGEIVSFGENFEDDILDSVDIFNH